MYLLYATKNVQYGIIMESSNGTVSRVFMRRDWKAGMRGWVGACYKIAVYQCLHICKAIKLQTIFNQAAMI